MSKETKKLVGSYVHLRWEGLEGLEGYMADLNSMVREVHALTGDSGI